MSFESYRQSPSFVFYMKRRIGVLDALLSGKISHLYTPANAGVKLICTDFFFFLKRVLYICFHKLPLQLQPGHYLMVNFWKVTISGKTCPRQFFFLITSFFKFKFSANHSFIHLLLCSKCMCRNWISNYMHIFHPFYVFKKYFFKF